MTAGILVLAPGAWTFVLLALAAFRIYRLIARDTITEPVRALVSYPDDEAVSLGSKPSAPPKDASNRPRRPPRENPPQVLVRTIELPGKPFRVWLSTLIRCPWCAGFYVSVAFWLAWSIEPRWTVWCAVPWALSGALGLAAKLDR